MSCKLLLLVVSILVMPLMLNAQRIAITLPQQTNKEYIFVLNKGISRDTIQQGVLSSEGKVEIRISDLHKDYVGMGALIISGMPIFNMIINHESFSVVEIPEKKYIFKNSPENEYLYSIIQDKVMPQIDTSLYAYRFIQLIRYNEMLNRVMSQRFPDLREKGEARLYALNDLDFEALYTSGLWYNVIDALVNLSGDQQVLGEYMIKILDKIKSDEVYVHLVSNLITITEQYGWDDAFDVIVPYVEKSGRIPFPQGQIYTAFALAKVRKGMDAPNIDGLAEPIGGTGENQALIVFYQPDCENCHRQMSQLVDEYPKLVKEKIRVVSISGGDDKDVFEQEKSELPWSDKLCDFKGYSGRNFLNYGIMATPTFFLVNKDGKVLKRFARTSDLKLSNAVL